MKIKSLIYNCLIVTAGISSIPKLSAQTASSYDVMSSSSEGYFSRGEDMLRHGDYVGAIDQLRRCLTDYVPSAGDKDLKCNAISLLLRAAFERGDEQLFYRYYDSFLKDYNGSPQALEAECLHADFLFFKGDYPASVKAYSDLDYSAMDPANEALYRYRLGVSLTRTGYFDEAAEIFTLLRGNSQYSAVSRFYLAYIDYVKGNLAEARREFNEVPTDMATQLGTAYYVAQIDFELGDYSGVIQRVPSLLKSAPAQWSPEMNRILGESYYNLGDVENAETYLRKYISLDKEPQFTALYDMGVICYDAGNYEEAREYFSRLVNEADTMAQSSYLYLGQIEARQGDYSSAAMAFSAAYDLNVNPDISETALYNYAVATMKGGQIPFGSSSKMLETFVRQYPTSPYAAKIDEYLATACFNDKDYAGALKHIERLRNPSREALLSKQKILFQLGIQAMSRKSYGESAGYMSRAAEMSSQADKALGAQASLWEGDALYALGDYKGATAAYKQFVNNAGAKADNRALALYNLGYSLYQQKLFSEARKYFSEALKTSPKLSEKISTDCRLRIADCDYYAGNVSAAMDAYSSLAKETGNSEADYAAFQHANMMGASGNNKAKIKELEEMLSRWPSSSWALDARLELVNALCAINDISKASREAENLLIGYPSAPQTRKAALQAASAWLDDENYSKAADAYKAIVTRWPSSPEAESAVAALQTIYTHEGDLQGFISFLESVPSAPRPDESQMEELAFEAAYNKVKQNPSDLTPLESFISGYPSGPNVDRAMLILANDFSEKGNNEKALDYLNRLLNSRPDSQSVPAALMLKGKILEQLSQDEAASVVWQQLLAKGGALYTPEAYAGLMRTAKEPARKLEFADKLMDLPALDTDLMAEATLIKGEALAEMGRYPEAVSVLKSLASSPQSEQGAHAAVLLGELLLKEGDTLRAVKELQSFIDSDTSQFYWIARGYIALADAYHAQGDNYKAKEYLRALKSNYPGEEADIREMIDRRLKEWK